MKRLRFSPQGAKASHQAKQRMAERIAGRKPTPAPLSYRGYRVKTVAEVVAEEIAERKRHGPYQR